MMRCHSACVLAMTLALPSVAAADLVSHAVVSFGDAPLTTVETFGSSHASVSNSYASPGFFSGAAEAWAAYGLVRAVSMADALNASFETQVVQAEAAFTDRLTVLGGSGGGIIVYTYEVTGSTIGDEHDAHAHAFLRHEGDPDEEIGEDMTGSTVLTSLPHFFTFGVPFSTGLLLSAEIHLDLGHSGQALSDFSAGAMLTGISVFDPQMNPIAEFTIVSESGTSYPLPTPGAGVVLGCALLRATRPTRRA